MRQISISLLVIIVFSVNIFCVTSGARAQTYLKQRQQMVEFQILKRGITDKRILTAFNLVKRHLFVNSALRGEAYSDTALPIEEGQTISQPYIVAIMTYVIAPDFNKRVLEIGTGSGYQAAILAELVKEVYTIEIKKKLGQTAKDRLAKLGLDNITCKIGDGYLGWQAHAPFDGIIVTCSPDHIPPPLIEQLARGGRMVIPVSYSSQVQELILIEKDSRGKLKRTNLLPVRFVPLIRDKIDR